MAETWVVPNPSKPQFTNLQRVSNSTAVRVNGMSRMWCRTSVWEPIFGCYHCPCSDSKTKYHVCWMGGGVPQLCLILSDLSSMRPVSWTVLFPALRTVPQMLVEMNIPVRKNVIVSIGWIVSSMSLLTLSLCPKLSWAPSTDGGYEDIRPVYGSWGGRSRLCFLKTRVTVCS